MTRKSLSRLVKQGNMAYEELNDERIAHLLQVALPQQARWLHWLIERYQYRHGKLLQKLLHFDVYGWRDATHEHYGVGIWRWRVVHEKYLL